MNDRLFLQEVVSGVVSVALVPQTSQTIEKKREMGTRNYLTAKQAFSTQLFSTSVYPWGDGVAPSSLRHQHLPQGPARAQGIPGQRTTGQKIVSFSA